MLFKNNYEANGVIYNKFGKDFKVYALKSVVMSAGTMNTPKILMSSGIGPAHQLASLKVNTQQIWLYQFQKYPHVVQILYSKLHNSRNILVIDLK